MNMYMSMNKCMIYKEDFISSCLKRSQSFISHKGIKKFQLEDDIVGLKFQSTMDKVLVTFIPTFEIECYNFYKKKGKAMIDIYTKYDIDLIDKTLYTYLKEEYERSNHND